MRTKRTALAVLNIVLVVAMAVTGLMSAVAPQSVEAAGDFNVPSADYPTIQAAIDAAAAAGGGTVHVAAGAYHELISLSNGVVVRGAGADVTTINGDITGDGVGDGSVVTASGVDSTVTLEGFTITNGTGTEIDVQCVGSVVCGGGMLNMSSSPTVTNCTFSNNPGGGMANSKSAPIVTDCFFSGNSPGWAGGGMLNCNNASPTITSCTFFNNSGCGMVNFYASPIVMGCVFSGNPGGGMSNNSSTCSVESCTFSDNPGSGIENLDSSSTIVSCTFSGNSAGQGGGIYNYGASYFSSTIVSCTFSGNSAGEGGAIYSRGETWASDSLGVSSCTFSNNSATGSGGAMYTMWCDFGVSSCTFSNNSAGGSGGGMYSRNEEYGPWHMTEPTLVNCTFLNNSAGGSGGGTYFSAGGFMRPTLINCTFLNNLAGGPGGAYAEYSELWDLDQCAYISNCIMWGNGPDEIDIVGSFSAVTYSDVQGGYDGTGNIDQDPRLNWVFYPLPGSPCIDAGNNDAVPAGVTTDCDGYRRIADGDNDGNATVDMGAHEAKSIYHAPEGRVMGPVDSIVFYLPSEMDTSSFAIQDDISLFTGPSGSLEAKAYSWLNAHTLEVTFELLQTTGTYRMTIGPNILDSAGNALDLDRDLVPGEVPDDQYRATFQITAPSVLGHTPSGQLSDPVDSLEFRFDRDMDQSSFSPASDIASFTGPEGPIVATGYSWLDSQTLEVAFDPQRAAGVYEMVIGPQILDVRGNAMDQDCDLIVGEIPDDQYRAAFTIDAPQITSCALGTVVMPVESIRFSFNHPMDQTSFSIADDIASFTGSEGPMVATGYNWLDPQTLEVTFDPQSPVGEVAYEMVIGPQILDVTGNAMDQDCDLIVGEIPDDQYRTTFTITLEAPRVTAFTPPGTAAMPDESIRFSFNNPMDQTSFSIDDDVTSFTGPEGPIAATGYSWLDPQTLEVTFHPQSAVGGAILRYDGSDWSTMAGGSPDYLYSIWGTSASDVFAVGSSGTIRHYNGSGWSAMTSGTTSQLNGIWGSSGSNVFTVGNSGVIRHFNGSDWSDMTYGSTTQLNGIWGSSGSDIFAVGDSGVIRRYNGYYWWGWYGMSGTTSTLYGVWGTSASNVFAVGADGTILHYNGSGWSAMTSGTTSTLYGVWGSSNSDVFAVGADGTVLYYNGSGWSAMTSGSGSTLCGVWGSSNSDVFAVGAGGTVLHYNGSGWSAMTSGTGNTLWGVWGTSASNVFTATAGTYEIVIGPQIFDVLGNAMGQDRDPILGEIPDDQYQTTFTIAVEAPRVIGSTPSGTVTTPVESIRFSFNNPMDQDSFSLANDIASFTGPEGPMAATGYNWLDPQTLEVTFPSRSAAGVGVYEMVIGPQILDVLGNAMDQDRDWIVVEIPDDQYRTTFTTTIEGPRVAGSTPSGIVVTPVESIRFTFNHPMDQTSFSVANDIASFAGPGGPIVATGYNWIDPQTLEVSFPSQSSAGVGAYEMVIGPQILDVLGNAMDQDRDWIVSEIPDDQHRATFTTAIEAPRVTGSTPSGTVVTPVESIHFSFNHPMDQTGFSVADDIASFTGPEGPVVATGYSWLDSQTLQVAFDAQDAVGKYEMILGPDIKDLNGNSLDLDGDYVCGEVPDDQYNSTFQITGPRIIGQTPSGVIVTSASSTRFLFDRAMDQATFSLTDDIASFTGPQGPISANGYSWLDPQTLEVTFDAQDSAGRYQMILGPDILDLNGNPMDLDGDSVCGEVPDDQYVAAFSEYSLDIDRDTTWSSQDGVIVVDGPVAVASGATLTIEAGTIIKFTGGSSGIDVAGVLNICGTVDKLVVLTSICDDTVGGDTNLDGANTTPAPANWHGIWFYNSTDFSSLEGFDIRYAHAGVCTGYWYTPPAGMIRLSHGILRNNQMALVARVAYAQLDAEDCLIVNNQMAIAGRNTAEITLRNCTIADNGWTGEGKFTIFTFENCIFAFNGGSISEVMSPTDLVVQKCLFNGADASAVIGYVGQEAFDENGNINADPLFINRTAGNYELGSGSPAIDSGRGLGASQTDYLGRPRYDDLGMPNLGSGYPSYVDLGAFERQMDTVAADLAVTYVSNPTPEFISTGDSFSIHWTVANVGLVDCTATWVDKVYLSADPYISADDILLEQRTHAGGLATGASYTETLTAVAPDITGPLYVLVHTNAHRYFIEPTEVNNVEASYGVLGVNLPVLTLEAPVTGSVVNGQWTWVRFDTASGNTIVLNLEAATLSGATGLYVRCGSPPTLSEYDLPAAAVSNSPDQELRIPVPIDGTYYVGIYGAYLPDGSTNFTLSAALTTLDIRSASPNTVGNAGQATIKLEGDGFSDNAQVQLVSTNGQKIDGVEYYQGVTILFATFDLAAAGALPGDYDVVVTNPGADVTTGEDAVTVTTGGASGFEARLILPGEARPGRVVSIRVEYANKGTVDLPSPMLILEGPADMQWRAGGSGEWVTGPELRFLALSWDGPANVLRPGEICEFDLQITTPFRAEPLDLSLSSLGVYSGDGSEQAIDWDALETLYRPADVSSELWDPFWTMLSTSVGPTWGDATRNLAAEAASAGQLQPESFLVDYEFRQKVDDALGAGAVLQDQGAGAGYTYYHDKTFFATGLGYCTAEFVAPVRGWVSAGVLHEYYPDWEISRDSSSLGTIQWNSDNNQGVRWMVELGNDSRGVQAHLVGVFAQTGTPIPFPNLNWVQIVYTNEPSEGAKSPYVDPAPKARGHDSLPFYYPLADLGSAIQGSSLWFSDEPIRNATTEGVTWRAHLCLAKWDGDKGVTLYSDYSWIWGFDISKPEHEPPKLPGGPNGQGQNGGTILINTSISPEDKWGPAGYDAPGTAAGAEQRFLDDGQTFAYRIEMWNKPEAPVPTQDAVIYDYLDPNVFDLSTFEFTRVGFLKWDVLLPGGQSVSVRVDCRPEMNIAVEITGTFDPETGRIEWWFHTIDPLTGDYPEDPNAGFLPPFNPETGFEIGWMEFRVKVKDGLPTGTQIANQAFVQFDFLGPWGPAPKEGPWVNTVDAGAPASQVDALAPETNSLSFAVTWTGADDAGGSGIASYDVYVSDNGGPFTLWLSHTTQTQGTFAGQSGHTYAFYSVARDNVGHVEAAPSVPDASTTVNTVPVNVPVADFSATPTSGSEPLTVAFTDLSTTYDGPVSWLWNFGDGSTSTLQNPTHQYAQDGVYTITLTVTEPDADSDTETKTGYIAVSDTGPSAAFVVDSNAGNEPLPVTFTDRSASHDGLVSWLWDFGDGSTSTEQNPTHQYAQEGVYTVTLTVTEADADSDIETMTGYITVSDTGPSAAFVVDSNTGNEPLPVSFTDRSASYDGIVFWLWDFGDGQTSTLQNPAHMYGDSGIYMAKLTVQEADGDMAVATVEIKVNNLVPVVDAGLDATVNEGGTFTSSGSFADPGNDSWTATVDYGDGSGTQPLTLTGKAFDLGHVYADQATYTVTITVTDGDGGIGSATATVTAINVAPLVSAGPDKNALVFNAVSFSGSFTDPGFLDTHAIAWDFGDGSTANGTLTPTHAYSLVGRYTVTLTVTDDDGAVGTDMLVIEIGQKYAIWANSSNAKAIQWSGSGATLAGGVHSNGGITMSGSNNAIGGTVYYVSTFSITGSSDRWTESQRISPRPMPVHYELSDYQPGGTEAVRAQNEGRYHYISGNYSVSKAGSVLDGLYCVKGNVNLSASGIRGTFTIVAEGTMSISGSGMNCTAYSGDLLFFSNGTSLSISGSNSTLGGIIYAPNGQITISGSGNTINGSLFGDKLALSGSNTKITVR